MRAKSLRIKCVVRGLSGLEPGVVAEAFTIAVAKDWVSLPLSPSGVEAEGDIESDPEGRATAGVMATVLSLMDRGASPVCDAPTNGCGLARLQFGAYKVKN